MLYRDFASIYERLMQDVPYAGWVNYLDRVFQKHGIKPQEILDIGCGTGNVTIPLAQMGYHLTGLDRSGEMLALAEHKARTQELKINWLQQDMRAMDLGSLQFDLVIAMTDSLNYIPTSAELAVVFELVRSFLKTDGWFIFDLNTAYKIREVFGNNVFTLLEDEVSYIWENSYDPGAGTCTMDLTFFVQEKDGRYRRFSEQHRETGFEIAEVNRLLEEAGFDVQAVYGEDSLEPPADNAERIYFISRAR